MFRYNSQHTGVAISTITLPLTLQWSFETGDVLMSSPAVSGDRLFVGSYALVAATGKKLWEFQTEGPVTTSPAVSGDLVFVGSYEMNIYALNAATGKKLWEFQTDN
jgi:outer membrane protein assembly factor BamB